MSKIQFVVNIHGGLVQDVYCSVKEAEVIIVDWDTEGCILTEPGVARVVDERNREQAAFVSMRGVDPISAISGTETEAAIRYARIHDFEGFEHEQAIGKLGSE